MKFEAEVRQVKTMVDHSYNVTLNLPEYQTAEAQALLAMIGDMVTVAIQIAGINHDDRPTSKRRQR